MEDFCGGPRARRVDGHEVAGSRRVGDRLPADCHGVMRDRGVLDGVGEGDGIVLAGAVRGRVEQRLVLTDVLRHHDPPLAAERAGDERLQRAQVRRTGSVRGGRGVKPIRSQRAGGYARLTARRLPPPPPGCSARDLDLLAGRREEVAHDAGERGGQRVVHLHRFDDGEVRWPAFDRLALLDEQRDDAAFGCAPSPPSPVQALGPSFSPAAPQKATPSQIRCATPGEWRPLFRRWGLDGFRARTRSGDNAISPNWRNPACFPFGPGIKPPVNG